MQATAEREVGIVRSTHIERLRITELARIAVGCRQIDHDPVAFGKGDTADFSAAARGAREEAQWCRQAQAFLHRTVQQLVVGHNTLAHSRFGQDVLKQSCNGRCGRVVATEHEGLHDAGDELRVYRFAVDLAVGQRGEEVVGRLLLTLVELGLHNAMKACR